MGRGSAKESGFAKKTVDELVSEYKKMVVTGKLVAPFAAENLEHWLKKTGTKRIVKSSHFSSNSGVISHLKSKHREIFLSIRDKSKGLIPRIKKSPGSAKYSMEWEDSMYSTTPELFFALGGFTVRSKVDVQVTPDPKNPRSYTAKFLSWQSQAYDNYNWDHGKSVRVPGWGTIDDKDALRVERAGKAKSYIIESQWWRVTNAGVISPAKIAI